MHNNVAQQPITKAHKDTDCALAKERTPATASTGLDLAFERFLELPRGLVVAVLWMGGVALLGSIALVVYLSGWVLIGW